MESKDNYKTEHTYTTLWILETLWVHGAKEKNFIQ